MSVGRVHFVSPRGPRTHGFLIACPGFLCRVLTELVSKMKDMQMDKSELGCLRAIVLFNPGDRVVSGLPFSTVGLLCPTCSGPLAQLRQDAGPGGQSQRLGASCPGPILKSPQWVWSVCAWGQVGKMRDDRGLGSSEGGGRKRSDSAYNFRQSQWGLPMDRMDIGPERKTGIKYNSQGFLFSFSAHLEKGSFPSPKGGWVEITLCLWTLKSEMESRHPRPAVQEAMVYVSLECRGEAGREMHVGGWRVASTPGVEGPVPGASSCRAEKRAEG